MVLVPSLLVVIVWGGSVLGSEVQGEFDEVERRMVEVAYHRIHRRRPSQDGWEGVLAVIVLQTLCTGRAGRRILC